MKLLVMTEEKFEKLIEELSAKEEYLVRAAMTAVDDEKVQSIGMDWKWRHHSWSADESIPEEQEPRLLSCLLAHIKEGK